MQPAHNGNRHFRTIIFKPNILAPSSRLYHLEPVGIGTPDVESLTSYISRLAGAHLLGLRTLLRYIIGPLIEESRSRKFDADAGRKYVVSSPSLLNGSGSKAENWVSVLEELTLRRDLRSLTALPWGDSISQRRLMRPVKAWCPNCFEHFRQEGVIVYEPLLWSFTAVSVCPSHRRLLEQVCPSCKLRPPIIANDSRPGHCPRCREWLGSEDLTPSDQLPDSAYQINASQNVREWVGIAQNLPSPPSRNDFSLRLRRYINLIAKGRGNAFGRILNMSGREMRKWQSGSRPPNVRDLLKITMGLRMTLTRFLTDLTFAEATLDAEEYLKRLREGSHLKYLDKAEIERALEAAINAGAPPTIREFAYRFGYKSPVQLYLMFPELCRRLTQKCRAAGRYQLIGLTTFTEKDKRKMRRALLNALKRDRTPSLPQIAEGLGVRHIRTLYNCFPELYTRVKAKRAADKETLREDSRLRLKRCSEEWPPPQPEEVAKRFGYKHFNNMSASFPDIGRVILARYRAWLHVLKSELPVELRNLLFQNPPPSLNEVERLYEHSLTTLRKYHPEFCRAIIERRKNYMLQLTSKRREYFKDLVRGIAADIFHQGLRPSANRIWPLVVNQPGMGYVALTEVLRELRQEM